MWSEWLVGGIGSWEYPMSHGEKTRRAFVLAEKMNHSLTDELAAARHTQQDTRARYEQDVRASHARIRALEEEKMQLQKGATDALALAQAASDEVKASQAKVAELEAELSALDLFSAQQKTRDRLDVVADQPGMSLSQVADLSIEPPAAAEGNTAITIGAEDAGDRTARGGELQEMVEAVEQKEAEDQAGSGEEQCWQQDMAEVMEKNDADIEVELDRGEVKKVAVGVDREKDRLKAGIERELTALRAVSAMLAALTEKLRACLGQPVSAKGVWDGQILEAVLQEKLAPFAQPASCLPGSPRERCARGAAAPAARALSSA